MSTVQEWLRLRFISDKNGGWAGIHSESRKEEMMRRILSLAFLCILVCAVPAASQTTEKSEIDKLQAEVVRLYQEKKFKEALPLAEQLLKSCEGVADKDGKLTENALRNLAGIYSELEQYGQAAGCYRRILKIQEAALGGDAKELVPTLSGLAVADQNFGQYGDAVISLQRIIGIQEKYVGKDSAEVAQFLLLCAHSMRQAHNRTDEAIQYEGRAREIHIARGLPCPLSSGVLAAYGIRKIEPKYPSGGDGGRPQGIVHVQVVIDEKGVVTDAAVISGPKALRGASIEAARQWRFKPLVLEGRPAKAQGVLTFNFTLR
jgi:TonB family protein